MTLERQPKGRLRYLKLFAAFILVQLLVYIFSLFWFLIIHKDFEDFLELLLKRRHLKNLKKSANKFNEDKKFNIIMKTK